MQFSLAESVLVVVLVALSGAQFARGLMAKLRLVTAGPSDRARTDRVAARLRRTLREVFGQTRVVSGRPIVGLLHAIVFFGFLIFAAETTDHFLEPFGVHLLAPLLGPFYPTFHAALAVGAVAVGVAIVGLAFRRFVLVRYSPDPKSWSSGIVSLFILLLMLTYLNGARDEPFAERANWWLHALIILVFPHLILRSKHFHIAMAPVAIFLRTHRLGEHLPLNLDFENQSADDVTLGLETMRAVPWKARLDFLTCVECRRCTDGCPANLAGHELDPRGFTLAGRAALASCPPDAPVIGSVITEAALGTCVVCGHCENVCPVGVEHLQVLIGAKRAQALATGKGVVAAEALRAVETYGNPLSVPRDERRSLIADLRLPIFSGAPDEHLLWLGCVWGYSRDQRSAVAALQDVLVAAGVRFGVLADEPCCGHHSRRQGEEAQFQELANRAIAQLREARVRRIVTPCPHCVHTLRRECTQLDGELDIAVLHHSELMAGLLGDGVLRLDGAGSGRLATYHDPCYLARFEGVTDPPREILSRAGFAVTEMRRRRSNTLCCGGGAFGFVREQKTGRRLDEERRAEIVATGAPLLVTGCPECRMMLNAAVDQTKDLAEIVAEALRDRRTAAGLDSPPSP